MLAREAGLCGKPVGVGGKGGVAGGNTPDNKGRDFVRERVVGIVSLKAVGLSEGVDGLVGGSCMPATCILLIELACVLARDAAVVAE